MKEKFCLESIAPFKTINEAPTNRSTTKQTFSFTKTPRFNQFKSICPINSYNGDKILRKKSGTNFGYGQKSDFTKKTQYSPQSTRYNFKTIFDNNVEKKRGYSIGTSREKIITNCYIDPYKLQNPGIGRYHLQSETQVTSPKMPSFSMRLKTRVHDLTKTIYAQNDNPSPAQYNNNPQNSGTMYGSRFKSLKYSNSRSKRFLNPGSFASLNVDNSVPGPAYYQNPTNLSNVGKYVISNQKGGTMAKFDNGQRKTRFDEAIKVGHEKPGPGHYKATSQFGQYDGDVYSHLKSNNSGKKLLK